MYREILTKAIIAKGEKEITDNIIMDVQENISKVLGCWIINHKNTINYKDNKIYITGSYQCHIWYGYDFDTSSALKVLNYEFNDEIPYNFTLESHELSEKNDFKSYVESSPSCTDMSFKDKNINLTIIRKYLIDIIGETKLKIKVDDVIIDSLLNTNYVKNNE